ncbi:MAG: SLC13 family permease [Polyangiales bacterium]
MKRDLRNRLGLGLAPAVYVLTLVAPLPLSDDAHRLAAVFACIAVGWIFEPIPIAATSLLIGPLMVATGVTDKISAFAPYADPLIFLFIGGFFIAKAMQVHGLDRRLALALLARLKSNPSPRAVRWSLMFVAYALSMWVSNSAACILLLPILFGMSSSNTTGEASPLGGAGSALAIAYASSVGGMATLVGTPPNAIAVRYLVDAGVPFNFVDWLKIGLPVSFVLLIVIGLFIDKLFPASPSKSNQPRSRSRRSEKCRVAKRSLSFRLSWR